MEDDYEDFPHLRQAREELIQQGWDPANAIKRSQNRGWSMKYAPQIDQTDPGRLTCPACSQAWHVLPDSAGNFPDYSFLCPHGCNRKDLTNGKDQL